MTISALVRKGGLRKLATATLATRATEKTENAGPVARVARVAIAAPSHEEIDGLFDPAAEARRKRVLELLAANPTARRVFMTDIQTEVDAVILVLAIRGQATCEFRIPREKYDPFLLLTLIDRHDETIH